LQPGSSPGVNLCLYLYSCLVCLTSPGCLFPAPSSILSFVVAAGGQGIDVLYEVYTLVCQTACHTFFAIWHCTATVRECFKLGRHVSKKYNLIQHILLYIVLALCLSHHGCCAIRIAKIIIVLLINMGLCYNTGKFWKEKIS